MPSIFDIAWIATPRIGGSAVAGGLLFILALPLYLAALLAVLLVSPVTVLLAAWPIFAALAVAYGLTSTILPMAAGGADPTAEVALALSWLAAAVVALFIVFRMRTRWRAAQDREFEWVYRAVHAVGSPALVGAAHAALYALLTLALSAAVLGLADLRALADITLLLTDPLEFHREYGAHVVRLHGWLGYVSPSVVGAPFVACLGAVALLVLWSATRGFSLARAARYPAR